MTEVVILGAGYAGLRALHELQGSKLDFHITLIDRNDYHYEATDLHEVATGNQNADRISYEIDDVVHPTKTTFVQDTVTKIDRDAQLVNLQNGADVHYDYLIVGLGFQSESFGIPGVDDYALRMDDVASSQVIYDHIKHQMAAYKTTQDKECLKIIVCGMGFTGVELAGALVEARPKYAQLAGVTPQDIEIRCVEASTKLLPMFSEKLSAYGISQLTKWGVDILTGKFIKEIKPDTVVYSNGKDGDLAETRAKTIIWTTGVRGSQVMTASGFDEKRGRVMVTDTLNDPDHDNVYVVGDVSAVMDSASGRPFPTTAQISLVQGHTAAKNILSQLGHGSVEQFKFKSLGTVASIGNAHAFGLVGSTPIKGYPASVIKKMIMNKSLFETGGVKETLSKGRFDLYH